MDSNIRKGIIGELTIKSKLLILGFAVYNNICDDNGIDIIIENSKGKLVKIQIKTATKSKVTKDSVNKRISFRKGNTGNEPDFYICTYKGSDWIIPAHKLKCNAFQIYPNSKKSTFSYYFNRWDLLNKNQNDY